MLRSAYPKLMPLPFRKILGGNIPIVCDYIKEDGYEQLTDWYHTEMSSGQGLGEGEFSSKEEILKFLKKTHNYTIWDESRDKLLGMITLSKSKLVRSTEPLQMGGYAFIDKDYRAAGFGAEVVLMQQGLVFDLGYLGANGRVATSARTMVPAKLAKMYFSGTMPDDVYIKNIGLSDDMIVNYTADMDINEYERRCHEYTEARLNTPLPVLQINPDALPFLHEPVHIPVTTLQQDLTVGPAEAQDVWQVENMIREAAIKGEGFAIDEFTEDGYFNRNFFKQSHIITVKNEAKLTVAAAIFGPSGPSRVPKPPNLWFYVIVERKHQRKGIGSALIDRVTEYGSQNSYLGIVSDVFTNNHKGLTLMAKKGFRVTGSFRNSGVVINNGLTDSILYYKMLGHVSVDKWKKLSKM